DPVALRQPQPDQQMRGPIGPRVEFTECEAPASRVVDQRLQPRIQLGPLGQMRSNVYQWLHRNLPTDLEDLFAGVGASEQAGQGFREIENRTVLDVNDIGELAASQPDG